MEVREPGTSPLPDAMREPAGVLMRYANDPEMRWPPSETTRHESSPSQSSAVGSSHSSRLRCLRTVSRKVCCMGGAGEDGRRGFRAEAFRRMIGVEVDGGWMGWRDCGGIGGGCVCRGEEVCR